MEKSFCIHRQLATLKKCDQNFLSFKNIIMKILRFYITLLRLSKNCLIQDLHSWFKPRVFNTYKPTSPNLIYRG
jgi:hypothetical protein